MLQHLFVYGTLKPGLAPADVAPLVGRLELVGEGSVRGRLYLVGFYPGAIVDPGASTRIHGVVYRLPDDPAALAELDAYEEFVPGMPDASLFVRAECLAETAGGEIRCWIYVYNRPVEGVRRIEDGIFRR